MVNSGSYNPRNYAKLERQVLELKVTNRELNEKLRKALMELERTKESETQVHEALKKAKVEGKKSKKRRVKITKQQVAIDEAKERIAILTTEKKHLQAQLQELSLIHICRCRRLLTCRSRWSPYH
eukprot:TRINITY_DN15121_c0_g1_i3.p1 TRINITY_DN15121_c0_g1~~TRINITY_DN15121_c0_g1_i3.p1  ORF type:complete len:125 (-),score=47.57 TRINITY_DN15121_c0_g1_i3:41-415(-)